MSFLSNGEAAETSALQFPHRDSSSVASAPVTLSLFQLADSHLHDFGIMVMRRSIEPDESTRALSSIIRTRAPEIEQRWLRRVQEDVARKQDVDLTHLCDGIPDYLQALASLVSESPANDRNAKGIAIWARVAHDHGITRVRIGFDIEQLIHEFIVLRQEVRAVAFENGVATRTTEAALADIIDAAIAESVRGYVIARDYETRRVQAENIGFITHELRNPLTNAVYAAEMLRELATPEQAGACDTLDRSHRRLLDLIDSVLDAQRLQASKLQSRISEVSETDILERATEAARKAAEHKGIALNVRSNPARTVRVDPDLTVSALQNLVDNAVKYTDAGGVEVTIDEAETTWSIHVRDTCAGLSTEELRTIFEPFRRGSTNKEGTGLGLSIARRAIEAQGGSIHAESPGPAGCHFWITLPKK